ncbi:hypothetical protein BBF96_00770 [Anoxybacter fermentans]|uniref:DUF3842 domain-containing protein n=1 Tax=Anoxybacter fermentans TaxID=1323375 RepID=A0A3S9T2J9_9FIRM|nr:hypothetical protein BBF96_00770 [Anoxybacter fermentans]
MKIAVIDGMGGGLGSQIVTQLVEKLGDQVEIIALGTNAMATGRMMQSGAKRGATGENAIRVNIEKVDLIVGPLGIMMPNALMGEITPRMAEWIGLARGKKFLLPVIQPHFTLVGLQNAPMSDLINELILLIEGEVKNHGKEKEL